MNEPHRTAETTRYMIRGDTFAQHDLDAILDLIVAGLARPSDTPA